MKQKPIMMIACLLVLAAGCENADSVRKKLVQAIAQNDRETASALIHKFPELAKGTNDDGVPLLIVALDAQYPDMLELLLKNGADPNIGKPTPPLLAVMDASPHPREVKLLVDYGANVNITSGAFGLTPLMLAANFGDKESIVALVGKGADVNARDTAGKLTVLHHAIYGANADVVSYLLEKGAKADATDGDGQTPLEMALAAAAPQKTDEELQNEIAELAKTNPAAAANLGMQRIVRKNAGAALRGKDLTRVISVLRQSAMK